jgi:hypothetical protein
VDFDWVKFQQEMGYSDEELAIFRANPKAMRLLEQVDQMAAWDIIAEVMDAPGCANHKPGDKLILSPLGLLRASEGPDLICIHALPPLSTAVAVIQERLCSGLDPEPYMFDRLSCLDAGVRCGGWGQAFFKIYPVRRPEEGAARTLAT